MASSKYPNGPQKKSTQKEGDKKMKELIGIAVLIAGNFGGSFAGYNAIRRAEKIRVQHCWAHARREFFERCDDYPDECEKYT